VKATVTQQVHHAAKWPASCWRWTTASRRPLPDFVIVGAQRAGTTSLYEWLAAQPGVTPAFKKEIHYFDVCYDRGDRWYRSHFRPSAAGTMTGEASPYMLFHPLAPERAARDLDGDTRFIVLLRQPVERAVSHYWHARKANKETESFERAIALEPERLRGAEAAVRKGERSPAHQLYSYVARGEYSGQIRRWFDAVGAERVLVLESEALFADPDTADGALKWLGLGPSSVPFPALNGASRSDRSDSAVLEALRLHFEPHNRELFELLGREMWT
jgi:hypothetical protein